MRRAYPLVYLALLIVGCPSNPTGAASGTTGGGGHDAGVDAPDDVGVSPIPDGSIAHPCDLPGSVQFTASGTVVVPGGLTTAPSLSFLHLPVGFCAHYYGTVPNTRQLRFSPGTADLFVASPTTGTTGGGAGGQQAIVILSDINMTGTADAPITFLGNLPSTQGLLFANSHLYYQDGTAIMRVPYTPGDHAPGAASELVAEISYSVDGLHWPKALDVADDGTIYVGNGGNQTDPCVTPHTLKGAILKIDAAPGSNVGGTVVAHGLRNPIAVRCLKGHNTCFALELAKDYTTIGREKLIPIRNGDDWGFPCCATKSQPYTDLASPPPAGSCDAVVAETNSWLIGDTPFSLEFEMGHWPAPYAGNAFVATHGAAGTWTGTRIVTIPMDPNTGLPTPSSNTTGTQTGMTDFATGWFYDTSQLTQPTGRPAALAFHPDGRLFVGNDYNGVIFWIAPLTM